MNDDQRDAILLEIKEKIGHIEEYIEESKSNKKFWLTGLISAIIAIITGWITNR